VQVQEGAIVTDVAEAQRDAYERDSQECLESTGFDPDRPLTPADYDIVYAWYDEIATCLETAGFNVPAKPSRAEFEDTYNSAPWIPWLAISGPRDMSRALTLCPMIDPSRAG